jgi:hypothetical protein
MVGRDSFVPSSGQEVGTTNRPVISLMLVDILNTPLEFSRPDTPQFPYFGENALQCAQSATALLGLL